MTRPPRSAPAIELVLADVDGTLVTPTKELTPRAIAAVRALRDAGIRFTITSGRPPRGMQMLVEPLALELPIAAFNGGLFVRPDMSVIEERAIPPGAVPQAVELLDGEGLDAWIYRGTDWLVRDTTAPHVAREAATVQFDPVEVADFDGLTDGVVKIVGVSDDEQRMAGAVDAARKQLGDHVSAALSQPYYLDITHPHANKGNVVAYLARVYHIPTERIATLGDMPNDVLMFAHSGLSIAMGNASREVQRAARRVTASNDEDGFALAIERFVLGGGDDLNE